MATTDDDLHGTSDASTGSELAAETNWAAERARSLGLARWPDVIRDLEAGRGFAAHDRLRAVRRKSPADGERERIDAALAESRLFAEPLRSAPGLQRINGVGPAMIGAEQRDSADGSYVKTRWLTFVFVPVLPLDAWLVTDAPNGGWHFHARVPVVGKTRTIRTAALCALGAGVVAVGLWLLHRFTHSDLHVVNGLESAAELTIDDDAPIVVDPAGRVTVVASSGEHRFRCTVAGRVVSDTTERVSGTADLVVYNVAGAAPLFIEDVEYRADDAASKRTTKPGSTKSAAENEPRVESLAGQVFIQRETVQFVFSDAPTRIELDSKSTSAVRYHADVLDGGWRTAVGLAHRYGGAEAAEKVVTGVATAVTDDPLAVREMFDVALRVGSAAAATRMSERLVAASPKSAAARRALQDARLWSGQSPVAASEGRAALAQSPDSPQLMALLARVTPRAEAQALVKSALATAADDPLVQEMAFRVYHRTGMIAEAAAQAERILGARDPQLSEVFASCGRALHAAGKPERALDALSLVLDDAPAVQDGAVFVLGAYERIRIVAGDSIPARRRAAEWVPKLVALQVDATDASKDAADARRALTTEITAWIAVLARDEGAFPTRDQFPAGAAMLRTGATVFATWRDPAAAVREMSSVAPEDVHGLEPEILIQLGAELARVGRTADAAVVHAAMPPWAQTDFPDPTFATLPPIEAFAELNGAVPTAALTLAWAARESNEERRAELVARARTLDSLDDVHAW
ncbi:MAG: hypothetical protein K8T90_16115 [Planctomycetes bacterium]|nr:hypothetical protein [Planctomycetota bacterium]